MKITLTIDGTETPFNANFYFGEALDQLEDAADAHDQIAELVMGMVHRYQATFPGVEAITVDVRGRSQRWTLSEWLLKQSNRGK